jgi:hypothetical protein
MLKQQPTTHQLKYELNLPTTCYVVLQNTLGERIYAKELVLHYLECSFNIQSFTTKKISGCLQKTYYLHMEAGLMILRYTVPSYSVKTARRINKAVNQLEAGGHQPTVTKVAPKPSRKKGNENPKQNRRSRGLSGHIRVVCRA